MQYLRVLALSPQFLIRFVSLGEMIAYKFCVDGTVNGLRGAGAARNSRELPKDLCSRSGLIAPDFFCRAQSGV
jgi:hypothetical protein